MVCSVCVQTKLSYFCIDFISFLFLFLFCFKLKCHGIDFIFFVDCKVMSKKPTTEMIYSIELFNDCKCVCIMFGKL